MQSVTIPDAVQERVVRLGPAGLRWLEDAPRLLAEAAGRWGVELGYAVDSASPAVVVRGRRRGRPCVLKVWPDPHRFAVEERVLRAARGRGYAHLYESDADLAALLVESLGPPLDVSQAGGAGQAALWEVVARTLTAAWSVPLAVAEPGAHPAATLRRLIELNPPPIDVPDCRPAIERALLYAGHRLDDDHPDRHVVLHGDPAPPFFRQVSAPRTGAESGHVLISPHGLRGDREYDLGVLIRESRPLLHEEDSVVLVRGWCAKLAELTGSDAELIWQWAFLQRVADGLALVNGPAPLSGRIYLQTAMVLIGRSRR